MTIEGVKLIKHQTYPDERGFFREVLSLRDKGFTQFGQLNHSYMRTGVVKAWHYHKAQEDFWYIVSGCVKAVLWDLRESSQSYNLVEEYILTGYDSPLILIPKMVAHGVKALEPTHMIYVISQVYDKIDEGRIDHDSPQFPYDWEKGFEIK